MNIQNNKRVKKILLAALSSGLLFLNGCKTTNTPKFSKGTTITDIIELNSDKSKLDEIFANQNFINIAGDINDLSEAYSDAIVQHTSNLYENKESDNYAAACNEALYKLGLCQAKGMAAEVFTKKYGISVENIVSISLSFENDDLNKDAICTIVERKEKEKEIMGSNEPAKYTEQVTHKFILGEDLLMKYVIVPAQNNEFYEIEQTSDELNFDGAYESLLKYACKDGKIKNNEIEYYYDEAKVDAVNQKYEEVKNNKIKK